MARKKFKVPRGELQITSMMDMFTIVLVFLIMNFGAEGNLVTSAPNLILPNSKAAKSPQELSMNIAVDEEWLMVDDQHIMKTTDASKQDSLILAPVLTILTEKRDEEIKAEMARLVDPSRGKIIVQFDRDMEYDIVTKVVATCGFAGYTNIKFAVLRTGEEL